MSTCGLTITPDPKTGRLNVGFSRLPQLGPEPPVRPALHRSDGEQVAARRAELGMRAEAPTLETSFAARGTAPQEGSRS
jgi:hypothetical protein